jgi:hypothetical protein
MRSGPWGVTFIDLHDRLAYYRSFYADQPHCTWSGKRREWIRYRGVLAKQSPETINPNLPAGELNYRFELRNAQSLR